MHKSLSHLHDLLIAVARCVINGGRTSESCRRHFGWVFLVVLLACAGCGGGDEAGDGAGNAPSAQTNGSGDAEPGPTDLPPPTFDTGECLVYSTPLGCQVYLDGYPVLDEAGNPAVTPCAVTAGEGRHTVTLIQPPHIDVARDVRFAADEPAMIDVNLAEIPTGDSVLLGTALSELTPGEPVALTSLNSPFKETDPHLSADGRLLWFSSNRFEGNAIYFSVRTSPLDQFPPPEQLSLTRSRDGAVSPSVMDDGSLVYLSGNTARAWQLVRSTPLGPFNDKEPLAFRDEEDTVWASGQITGDGLRFYFTQQSPAGLESRVFVRDDVTADFERELIVEMPGVHPHLSVDGLRQYVYDGQTLSRARRDRINRPFSKLETVCQVAIDNFVASEFERQYCISDDEQWIVYSDSSAGGGDLYLARLSRGAQWGPAVVARAIEPRELAMVDNASPEEMEDPGPDLFDPDNPPAVEPEPVEPVFDPLLVDYEAHRGRTSELLRIGDIAAVREHIDAGLQSPGLAGVTEALQMDLADAAVLEAFWNLVDAAASELSPGATISVNRLDYEIVSYADRTFQTLLGNAPREVKLHDLDYTFLLDLAERSVDPAVERGWLLLLLYTPDYPARSRERRLTESPEGVELLEREASRLLIRAKDAMDRNQLAQGLLLLDQLEAGYPDTESAAGVAAIRESQYDRTPWNAVGPREWQRGPLGEWTAVDRVEGSWLQSPNPYGKFQLSMEYRTNDPLGQGGVYFRYDGEGRIDRETFKIQLTNDAGLNADVYCTGSLFAVERPRVNAAQPQGEWNTFLMEVDGEKLKVTINGEIVLDTYAVENAVPLSGYVVLDGVTGGISYRKIVLSGEP